MKTIKSLILVAFVLLGIKTSMLKAAEPTIEQIADRFAQAPAMVWYVVYTFNGNGTNQIEERFTLEPHQGRWGITQLSINGKDIVIDAGHPLTVLPAYAGTATDIRLRAEGYGANGEQKRYGYMNVDTLKKTEDIAIQVNLSWVYLKIPYAMTGGHTANNTQIQSEDGNSSGWYDSSLGVFVIGFDPLRPPTGFNLIDSRNNSIFGWIPFKGKAPDADPSQNDGVGISLEIPGGTLETTLTDADWNSSFRSLKLDQTIPRLGKDNSGKIVLLHVADSEDYVQVFNYGLTGSSWIEAYGLETDGVMKLLALKKVPNDQGESVIIQNLTGYQTYKIVVIGKALNSISGASVDFYRSDYSWSYQDGPKG